MSGFIDQNMAFYNVRIKTSKNSFLGKISELSSSRVLVNVYNLPNHDYYFIAGMTYGKIDAITKQLLRDDYYLKKSKIFRINIQKIGDLYIIYGLKRICEFYRLAQENNVNIVVPYIFDRGSRDYLVVGSMESLRNYIKALEEYYGSENIKFSEIDSVEKFSSVIVRESMLNLILDKLTPSERKILRLALDSGYFEYPKNAGQFEIGSYLGLSKVTVSIHLRKALKKILKDFAQFLE